MKCSLVQEKLSCYLDGILDEATLEAVEHHLDVCHACRQELEMLKVLTLAASEIEEVTPPASLKDSIREAVAAETAASSAPCEEYLVALSTYADGELSLAETAELMGHLKSCPACVKELQMLRSLTGTMTLVDELEPPADLRERIAAATTKAPTLKTLVSRVLESLVPSRLGYAAAGTLAAAAIIAYMTIGPSAPPEPIVAKVQPSQPHGSQPNVSETPMAAESAHPEEPAVVAEVAPPAQPAASEPADEVAVEGPRPMRVAVAREPREPRPVVRRTHVPTIEERTVLAKVEEQPKPAAEQAEMVAAEARVAEESTAQPTRIRLQEASLSQAERLERFTKDVKIEVQKRQKPDDYAKLDIITITH